MGAYQLSRKTRQSNIELLRIISMFLVLVVHANFWALGRPTSLDMQMSPLASYTRFLIESLAIVCVNVFVLISGWFGIKPSVKGFSRFAFQCLFFLIGHYVVGLAIGTSRLDIKGIAGCFCLLSNHWFIKSYIGLYILAPILNAFVKVADKKQLKLLLIVFFLYQTIYGWSGAAAFFVKGYSTMSFIGLYLLGRYLNLYGNTQSTPPYVWICVYLTCGIVNTVLAPVVPFVDLYAYLSPVVIIASVSLFLGFVNLKIRPNKTINWIAASSFAIFLFHSNPNGMRYVFKNTIAMIYSSTDGILCLFTIGLFLLAISAVAIILDQIRILLWKLCVCVIERSVPRHEFLSRIWAYRSHV